MSKQLWCIRHGTAVHNVMAKDIGDKAYTDYTDTPLVEKGQNEATELCKTWTELKNIEIVYVSPLTRTLQTATNIFKNSGKKFVAIDELMEYPQGVHFCNKRKNKSELMKLFPHVDFSLIQEKSQYWNDTVFESVDDLKQRIQLFKDYVKETKQNNISVVAHSSFLKQFLYDELGDVHQGLRHCYPYDYKL